MGNNLTGLLGAALPAIKIELGNDTKKALYIVAGILAVGSVVTAAISVSKKSK